MPPIWVATSTLPSARMTTLRIVSTVVRTSVKVAPPSLER
jgi:hypothetical protein